MIFGLEYGREIDLWSFACVIVELYSGRPLFPGQNEQDQVSLISEIIGAPKAEYIRKLPRRKYFFSEKNELKPFYNEFGKRRSLGSRNLQTVLNTSNK